MSKFQIDLNNYPNIQNVFDKDKERFAYLLKNTMEQLNDSLDGRHEIAQDIYKLDYLDMQRQVMDAFFDIEGIAQQHHHKAEQEGLKALQYDLHPLAIFTNKAVVYDVHGNRVDPSKWIQQEKFNIKDWLLALFYGARFVSWHELASYLSLGQYDLLDVLAVQNFPQLAYLQPALTYQEEHGIPKGKLIPGTSYLDGGDEATRHHEICPACSSTEWILDHEQYAYCESCSLGGRK